uniref:Uncharacterized protein n=1 Tax=Trepomonas sp. PC1 TaxID=1076344 RepID=A0A146K6H4_9EUKA|eukprot:JAP92450.1 hypothetical protein TPC1_15606 [Trepomonas sp. PC1]
MPQTKIDSKLALAAVAQEVSKQSGVKLDDLLDNVRLLDETLQKCKIVDWERIGKHIGQRRQQMYRWYHDTHQRKLHGAVSAHDICAIRQEIERGIRAHLCLDQEFQKEIKQRLSKQYHRNSFTVAFNNQKRLALQKLQTSGDYVSYIADTQRQNDSQTKLIDLFCDTVPDCFNE